MTDLNLKPGIRDERQTDYTSVTCRPKVKLGLKSLSPFPNDDDDCGEMMINDRPGIFECESRKCYLHFLSLYLSLSAF